MGADLLQHAPWPHFDEEMLEAAREVLRSGRVNWWTGEHCRLFEREWEERFGVGRSLAMANGSVSIEVALRALGIGPGDEVVVTPRSFVASASSVVQVGAVPVFADIDRESQNITAEAIAACITPRTRAIIPVHLSGWPCDMPAIMALAEARGLEVIEDCAQAHGATIDGRPIGGFGRISSWSFCQDKLITTGGEGGMLSTRDPELWKRAWSLSQHGKNWEACFERPHGPGFRWLVESFGTNHRMTEIQAALGRVQLRRLDGWIAARRRNAAILREALAGSRVLGVPWPSSREGHVFYRVNALVQAEALEAGWSRDRLLQELLAAGVPCAVGACPEIYREQAFVRAGLAPAQPCPVAAELGEVTLAFLVHPTIDDTTMRRMAAAIAEVAARAEQRRTDGAASPDRRRSDSMRC